MPRISEATRKWQKKVKDLEADNGMLRVSRSAAQDQVKRLEGKLERYEKAEQAQDIVAMEHTRKLESEVEFLRGLVREMVVSPDTLQAIAKNEVRFQESRNRERRAQEKEWRRQENERRLNETKIKKESALK